MAFKVTWLGHASFAMEIDGTHVLLDPFLTGNPVASTTADRLEADYIIVSHGHGDHVGDTVEIARRTGAKCIANAEIAGWLREKGLEAHGQHIGGGYHHPFGYVKLTIAHHGSALPDGSYGGNPAGILLTLKDDRKVYFACDTGLFYEMKYYGDEGIDLAFLPIGDNFTMGPDDAFKAVELLRPKVVVPVHYDTWPPIQQDAAAWVKRVNENTEAKAIHLKPGESYSLD